MNTHRQRKIAIITLVCIGVPLLFIYKIFGAFYYILAAVVMFAHIYHSGED